MSDPQDYTVGWICALPTELVASQAFLDERHGIPAQLALNDTNHYILGRIGSHNVAMAVLPDGEYGTASAANVASHMRHSFPNIRIGLMVGIGGGAPSPSHDIRLGDVVVSSRTGGQARGGVFQYDYGKTIQGQAFQHTGFLDQPPTVLRTAVNGLKVKYDSDGYALVSDIDAALKNIKKKKKYTRPNPTLDRLHKSDITHLDACGEACGGDESSLVLRGERDEEDDDPAIHYGTIASANSLMKDAVMRDSLAAEEGVLCFEMEAAGLMNNFPCLVVRGICDYSDSHKNKEWQGFAAMAAAAYAKDLLQQIPPNKIEAEKRIGEVLGSIHETVDHVKQVSDETKITVQSLRSGHDQEAMERWLSPADPSTNANRARDLRHAGTGTWILENPTFLEWISGSRKHLWLQGLAGCGKTVLSATVLDHLSETRDQIPLSFFFDFSDARKQTVDDMLRSLAFQMYRRGGEAGAQIDKLFQTHQRGARQASTKALIDGVNQAIGRSKGVFVILDALDESTARAELLRWIRSIVGLSELDSANIMFTSRPEHELLREIPLLIGEGSCITPDKGAVDADIRSYAAGRLENSPEFAKWAAVPTVVEQIRDVIGSRADGLFRWAACQLDSLETCLDPEGIEMVLETLPRDLNETYDRMLQGIPPERKHKAIRLLQFLVYSEVPLTLQEVVDVIAIRMKGRGGEFKAEDRVPVPSDVLGFCQSLVSIVPVQQHAWSAHTETTLEVHLAHFSVKEYLLCGEVPGFGDAEMGTGVTEACMAYLSSAPDYDEDRSGFPLATRATAMFEKAAVEYEKSSEEAADMTLQFLKTQSILEFTFKYEGELSWEGKVERSSLYEACRIGLLRISATLISEYYGVKFSPCKGKGSRVASANGPRGMVELGEFVYEDTWTSYHEYLRSAYGHALRIASARGHREVAQFLLDTEAHPHWRYGTVGHSDALRAASANGYPEVVQLLLERGVDANAMGTGNQTALQAASELGFQEVVRILLDHGADVNSKGRLDCSALHIASYGGHRETVQVLLDRRADVNTEGYLYGSPLQAASSEGLLPVVQVLIRGGADVDADSRGYAAPLPLALHRGHREIAQLLLENGARAPGWEPGLPVEAISTRIHAGELSLRPPNAPLLPYM